jgi:hypothetical protein
MRTKRCPGCGLTDTRCRDCPYLDGRPERLADWRPLPWPRKLTPGELDAFGIGYDMGFKHGYKCGGGE